MGTNNGNTESGEKIGTNFDIDFRLQKGKHMENICNTEGDANTSGSSLILVSASKNPTKQQGIDRQEELELFGASDSDLESIHSSAKSVAASIVPVISVDSSLYQLIKKSE